MNGNSSYPILKKLREQYRGYQSACGNAEKNNGFCV